MGVNLYRDLRDHFSHLDLLSSSIIVVLKKIISIFVQSVSWYVETQKLLVMNQIFGQTLYIKAIGDSLLHLDSYNFVGAGASY